MKHKTCLVMKKNFSNFQKLFLKICFNIKTVIISFWEMKCYLKPPFTWATKTNPRRIRKTLTICFHINQHKQKELRKQETLSNANICLPERGRRCRRGTDERDQRRPSLCRQSWPDRSQTPPLPPLPSRRSIGRLRGGWPWNHTADPPFSLSLSLSLSLEWGNGNDNRPGALNCKN